ncbi:MAG: hypothetical protein LBV45_06020 [Xanthomonadaceae bacterium]|jgi:hypothetical protein|nr:hypothetical protein [Xanthomonadaceae bacterium]
MKFLGRAKHFVAGAAVVGTTVMASGYAFAGEFSEAMSSGFDATELTAIGVVVLTATGIIFLIRSGRRAGS